MRARALFCALPSPEGVRSPVAGMGGLSVVVATCTLWCFYRPLPRASLTSHQVGTGVPFIHSFYKYLWTPVCAMH